MIIRVYHPHKKETLYDASIHNRLVGVLFFQPPQQITELIDQPALVETPAREFTLLVLKKMIFSFILFLEKKIFGHALMRTVQDTFVPIFRLIKELYIDFCVQFFGLLKDIFWWIANFGPREDFKKIRYFGKQVKVHVPVGKGDSLGMVVNGLRFIANYRQRFVLPLAFVCLIISFLSIGAIVFPLVSAQLFAQSGEVLGVQATPLPTYTSYYQDEKDPIYPIRDFRLVIPKINLESNIVDNVDPQLEDEYKEKLQFGVAHAKGSYLPAEKGGPVYLFAHSTDSVFNIARFNAKFYSVRELEAGDEIQVYFNGKEYHYTVKDKFIINPQEVDVVQSTQSDLILQTCWPPGTDWQRLIVLADLAGL